MSSPALHTEFSLPNSSEDSIRSFDRLFSAANNTMTEPFLQSVPDGMIVLDRDGRVVYLNNRGALLLGLDPQGVVGRFISDVVDFRPTVLAALESGEGYLEREFAIDSPSRGTLRFTKSAVVVRDDNGQVLGIVDYFRRSIQTDDTEKELPKGHTARYRFSNIVGPSPGLRKAVDTARKVAHVDTSILLQGESGTGKEMFAHAIHDAGPRRNGPFVTVNCGSIPESLIESELFGYTGGTFTGADRSGRPGVFEQANGGTLFLDEVSELPIHLQTKLLRVLQDGVVKRLGGQQPIYTDVRVLAATNSDLRGMVDDGRFRLDLFFRLAVVTIRIPPLRERPEDIEILLKHLGNSIAADLNVHKPAFARNAISVLMKYSWPGNVRELRNEIERALILAEQGILTVNDFQSIADRVERENATTRRDYTTEAQHRLFMSEENGSLAAIESTAISATLEQVAGNVSRAARILGISRNTLYRKMEQFGIEA